MRSRSENARKPLVRKLALRRPSAAAEDAADNAVCDRRETEKRYPIGKLFRKYGHELAD